LLQVARDVAQGGVIFKRPFYLSPDPRATLSKHSKVTHFDVYLTKAQQQTQSKQQQEQAVKEEPDQPSQEKMEEQPKSSAGTE
jgi:hypothetical protein